MTKKKKIISGCILICLFGIVGIYSYVNINQKNNFKISQVSWDAETANWWTDNTQDNIYDVKFQVLEGTDLREISSLKSTYNMKIDSNIESGDLNIKIYNDNKILFEESGSVIETISISNNDSKNVRIETTGKKAKGHIKIKLV